jgi:hypothetical protein
MDFSQLMALAGGHVEARIVHAALRLGLFDALAGAPDTAASLAAKLDLDQRASELLLNALAAIGLVRKRNQLFSLTPVAQDYLVRSSPRFVGAMILFEDSLWGCWEKLPDSVRSGVPARPPDMYQNDPRETEIFINAMDALVKARGDSDALIQALDWQGIATLLDIGSGPATYPIALCRRFPALRATVFDLPATLRITRQRVREAGMTERITLVPGDYRTDAIPGRYDAVFLSNIIHAEDERQNEMLIVRLADNLTDLGRIIVKDHILDESRTAPPVGAVFSLLMLLTTSGGRCYSFTEISGWMERAGLRRIDRVDLPPPLTSSLVIATRD